MAYLDVALILLLCLLGEVLQLGLQSLHLSSSGGAQGGQAALPLLHLPTAHCQLAMQLLNGSLRQSLHLHAS